jgi:hypothetical protein
MTLPLKELEEEAKECNDLIFFCHPIFVAAKYEGMGAAIERLQRVFCSSVNATRDLDTAIMSAAVWLKPDNVRLFAKMGTDLSLRV